MRLFVYEYTCAQNSAGLPASLCAEGRAMLTALVEDVERSGLASVVTLPPDVRDEVGVFQAHARAADFTWAVAPEYGDLLATRCRWTAAAGGRWLGSSLAALRLTADKLALGEHLHRHGVPTPECQPAVTATWTSFPCVCKPRYGAGSQATFWVGDAAALAALLADPAALEAATLGEPLRQPFVPGMAASVAVLMGPRQTVALLPAVQQLSQDGRFHYLGGTVPLPESLAARAVTLASRAVVAVPGLSGYVGVDLVLGAAADGSADFVIEINPRLTTSYLGLRALCRDNLAATVLRLAHGEEVPPLRWHPGAVRFGVDGTLTWRKDSR